MKWNSGRLVSRKEYGLKIAFWSNTRGRCGVTANMVCTSALITKLGISRNILLENHYGYHNIAQMLLPQEQVAELKECGNYYGNYGIEYVLKRLYGGESGDELLRQAAISLLCKGLYYLPQSYIVNKEVFNYEFNLAYKELFQCLEEFAKYIFVDIEQNQNLTSNAILSDADLIVVNLTQDIRILREFFDNYPSIQEKSVYLIGAYQPELSWSYRKICYEFHIRQDKIGMIPYNMEFADAMENGRTLQFLNRNYEKASGRENAYFMNKCKKAAVMIRKNLMEIRKDKKERVHNNILDGLSATM